jgi:hypothetical protein
MKTKALMLSAIMLVLSLAFEPSALANEVPHLTVSSSDFLQQIEAQMEPVMKQHFPRAVVKKTANSFHVEFKAQKFATIDGGALLSPKTDGIVFDVDIKPGKYKGKHMMPLTTNETLYYSVTWALYSPSENNHVVVKVLFPHDISVSVSDELKESVQSFVRELESSSTSSSAQTTSLPVAVSKPQQRPAVSEAGVVKVSEQEPTKVAETKIAETKVTETKAAEAKASESKPVVSATNSEPAVIPSADKENPEEDLVTKTSESTKTSSASAKENPSTGSASASNTASTASSSEQIASGGEFDMSVLKDTISGITIPKFSEGTTPSASGNAFAPAAKPAEKPAAKAAPPKTPPKPTKEYFQSWFSKFFKTTNSAHYMTEVLPYYSADFHRTKLPNVERLDAVTSNFVFKQFKKQTHLTSWSIEKVQPGPLGCMDVIVNGKTVSDHPAYLIYRMVAEGGTWRIDNGRGRYWTSGSRGP